MPSRIAARLARPYIRHELPAWGRLYRHTVGPSDHPCWKGAPTRVQRGKLHHLRMRLDLSDWSERASYFLARYYDLDSQLVYKLLIDPGDQVLDVGANIGMMMLLASHLVGRRGRVDCVEPNPECIARIHDHIELNALTNAHVHNLALGDENTELVLRVVTKHTGSGTLTHLPQKHAHLVSDEIPVPVRVGDELVAELPAPPRLIKIDVEGFELRALQGLETTVTTHHPILMLEFVAAHLRRAGTSRAELTEYLNALGYSGFATGSRRGLLSHQLTLNPIEPTNPDTTSTDTVWIHPDDPRAERLKPFIAA